MQGKLGKLLRNQRHHACVVRPRRKLAEPYLVALHEELDAKKAESTERLRHGLGHALAGFERCRTHRLGLPGLAIVAVHLHMSDRRAEARSARVTHGKQRDLVLEIDEAFDNHGSGAPRAPVCA